MKPTSAKHTTVPQHKETRPEPVKMARYWLTDVETALVGTEEQHRIPTAKDRGIEFEVINRKNNLANQIDSSERLKRLDTPEVLTKEYLTAAMHNGMTVTVIAKETGIAYSTVCKYMRLHGVENTKRKQGRGTDPMRRM